MSDSEWIIPYKNWAPSMATEVNFLYRYQNIYVSDNHRVALWCFFKHLNLDVKYRYLHIDAHYDALSGATKDFQSLKVDLRNISIGEFLTLPTSAGKPNLIRWDNYHPILFEAFDILEEKNFLTQKKGRSYPGIKEIELNELDKTISHLNKAPHFLNLDLDYFWNRVTDMKFEVTNDPIKNLTKLRTLNPEVVVCAVSPECCGGKINALQTLEMFSKVYQLPEDFFKTFNK
jgi:hypothetical protein